jgi:uncharacterized ion transporter superfamily protein YfcC
MKHYKKSQTTGRHVILMLIILLAVLIAWVILSGQAREYMIYYLDKIFT